MTFHRRALELFGQSEMGIDVERGTDIAQAAVAAGISLPAAVAEWFCVAEASPLWRAFARHDECLFRRRTGEPAAWWFGHAVRDTRTAGWWDVPAVCHDVRGWIAEPILPLMGECCGSWWWGVTLDGTADPRAVITHDEGETWEVCGTSFSTFVYSVLFDAAFDDPHGHVREIWLPDTQLYGPGRQKLREQFRVEPTTRVPYPHGSDLTERFSRDGQRVSVCNQTSPRGSSWRLWGATAELLLDLAVRVEEIHAGFGARLNDGVARNDSAISF
jgi:hypothetical protein